MGSSHSLLSLVKRIPVVRTDAKSLIFWGMYEVGCSRLESSLSHCSSRVTRTDCLVSGCRDSLVQLMQPGHARHVPRLYDIRTATTSILCT